MSHEQIAHRWAQRNARLSARGYAVFAEGLSIYSWGRHFEIARWVTTTPKKGSGQCAVMFNAATYSVSTSKHQSIVRRAIPHGVPVFTLPTGCWPGNPGFEARAMEHFETHALALYARASRARSNAPWLAKQADETLDRAAAFAEAFGIRWKRPDATALQARAAKRSKEQAAAAKAAAKRREAAAKAQREADASDFESWLSGAISWVPATFRYAPGGTAYIRRSPDGEELQTSQGASVPWAHAVKAFRFIKLCRDRQEPFKTNGRVVRVGHFTVDYISPDGNMTAGCHRFAWSEIERLAKREGVFDVAPSADAVETRN